MRSGCQGGFYSAFQYWSNVGARSSPQAINVTPVPVVHPENEIQNNMVASQNPGELGVAYGPARLQKSYAKSQQNSQGLDRQQESLAGTVSTGSQPSILTNTTTNFCTSADFHSSAYISAQQSSYFGTSVNGYSVRQFANNSGQQREGSKGNFRRGFLKGSNLNKNTGLQQRKHFNCAFSAGTNSAALQGDSLKVAQTVPLKVQRYSETVQKTCPLLFDLLSENPSDSESFTTKFFSSEETKANMALNTVAHVSGRHHKGQQVKSSLAALNCGQTRTQHLYNSGGTPSTPHQQQVSSPSLSFQPATDKVLSVGETKPPTDDKIHSIISKKLAHFRDLTWKKRSDGHSNKELGRDSILQPHLPTTAASREEDAMIEECSTAVGQYNCVTPEEDNSKGSKAKAEMGDCATSASEKHSTGILVTAVEKSALVVFDLSVKKHFDVSMPANSDCKLVYSDDCEDSFIGNNESFHSKWCDNYIENGMTTLNYSSTALKELIAILENIDSIAETKNVSKVILQQYWNGNMDNVNLFASTEYPHIMQKVAATCTKNEEERPGVLTAVPGMTWDDMRAKQPALVLNRSSSEEEYKSSTLSSNKNFDDIAQVPGVSWALNHMTEKKKGDTALKPVGTVGLDSATDMVDFSEDPQTKSSPVVSGNAAFGFSSLIINENAKEKKSIVDQQHAREDTGSVRSLTHLSIAVPENKLPKHAPQCESKVEEAHLLYEDVSDDDTLQLATELPTKEHLGFSSPACFEALQYEDISEAESGTESMAAETTIPTLVAAPNARQSPLENGGYGHVQGQDQMKTGSLVITQHCSCLCFVETDDSFESLCLKCDHGSQTNPSVSSSPSSVLSDEDETDDDHLVIPISIFNLEYEPEDKDQDSPETNVPSPKRCPSPNLVRTEFPPLLVFDTPESFLQSENKCEVAHEEDSEGDVQTSPKRRESVDSCETEDSCDYSAAPERNILTVSRKMLRKSSAPVPSETNDSTSEKESEGDEVTKMQKYETWGVGKLQKPRRPIVARAGCSKHVPILQSDIIVLDSDTEDESDKKCRKKVKRKWKRLSSSGSGDSDDAPCSQQKRRSPGTVKEKILNNRRPSVYSPAPLHQSKHDPPFQVLMQDASSDPSQCTEKSGQQVEPKAASEHNTRPTYKRYPRKKISTEKSVPIINSDGEDDHAQNYQMPSRKRFRSSGSHKGDAPCVGPKSVDGECGKLQQTRQSSADSPQRQAKLHDAQFREATEDVSSDLLHSGQLTEATGGSEHVPHKANRQMTSKRRLVILDSETVLKGHSSKKRAVRQGILSSGSEDSGDHLRATKSRLTESVDRLCGSDNTTPQKNKLSSEDLPEKQPQSVMKEADCHLPNNPVIPRYVAESSGPKGCLKLFKKPVVHEQGKDGTLSREAFTAPSKKTESCEKNKAPLYRNKKVSVLTPEPATDRNQAPKNNVQANTRKPTRVSRQLSLPVQGGSSTSFRSLSSTSRQLSVPRQSSASSRAKCLSKASSRLPYNPRELSFPPNLQQSYSSPSTLNHPPSKGPASTMKFHATGNAKEQVNSNHPIRGDRTNIRLREDNVRPERSHHDNRAPRKRRNPPKPATILMKKATHDAKQWTKAINRDSPKQRRDSVGEGYKWSEKSTKGPSREEKKGRSPPGPYL